MTRSEEFHRCDRREVAHQLVFALVRRQQRFVRGLRVGHHQQRVAIGGRLRRFDRADDAARAGAVLNHEGLAKTLLERIADLPGGDIGRPAGAEGHDDPDRMVGIVLRQGRCCGACAEQAGG
ncbi:hypothetical protein ACVWZV_004392 [Bradyrhizobium sp. GM5.1]